MLLFQFNLRAYLGLGLVRPIAGIAGVFLLKNAGESLQRQLDGYLHCKSRYSHGQTGLTPNISGIEGTTVGAFHGVSKTKRPVKSFSTVFIGSRA